MEKKLPKSFLDEMKCLLGGQYDDYLKSFEHPVRCGLRINTMKITCEKFQKAAPFHLDPVPWISDGFFYGGEDQPSKHPYYAAGLYYLQEPSAMTPADRLPIDEGDIVLDLCAAPGGKATKLACKLNGSGMLFANDISNSRAKALLKNLELFGAVNICVMSEDPGKLLKFYPEYFDKILIDAPCSGEGMFRKDHKMIRDWEEKGPDYYAAVQKEILHNAYGMLKPGGMIMYSTCTFSRKENEDNIVWFLKEYPDMSLEDISPFEHFTAGLDGCEQCVRLLPHIIPGEGHFLALLKKEADVPTATECRTKPITSEVPEDARRFLKEIHWKRTFHFHIAGDKLYGLPQNIDLHRPIRYLRTGLLFGTIRSNRFEPSQALAMALKTGEYSNCISLKSDDYRVTKYLKGDTLDITDCKVKDGWCLVCIDEHPLGWGKVQRGILKNKYYSGWRWQ